MKHALKLCLCGLLLAVGCAKKHDAAMTDSAATPTVDSSHKVPAALTITIPPAGQTMASNDMAVSLQAPAAWEHVTIAPPSMDGKSMLDSMTTTAVLSPTVTYRLGNPTTQPVTILVQPVNPAGDSIPKR